jgi:hypothetical protein
MQLHLDVDAVPLTKFEQQVQDIAVEIDLLLVGGRGRGPVEGQWQWAVCALHKAVAVGYL